MTEKEFLKLRRALGDTQAALGVRLGVSSARTVRRWENGERPIPGPVAKLLRLECSKIPF